MINLLYHSHTVVPGHLDELDGLGVLEPDEQVLVALDGILLDANGKRLSGPTLHDYCLVTTLRVILWARDYGRHLCYAFPLAELAQVDGAGSDPVHAQIGLVFVAPGEEDQRFTLALLPVASLQAGQTLLRVAATTARELAAEGIDAYEAGLEIMAVLGEQIYGHVDGLRPGESPYRWPGAAATPLIPGPGFMQDPANLPPNQFYAAGRLARSAWDTLRRSIREADLPFDLSSNSIRELTEAVRAVNDLVHTVAGNPAAQQLALAFLTRNNNNNAAQPQPQPGPAPAASGHREAAAAPAAAASERAAPADEEYHEIPFRKRGAASTPAPSEPVMPEAAPAVQETGKQNNAPPETPPDRREIPLRRREQASSKSIPLGRPIVSVSGSGDADGDERRRSTGDDRQPTADC